MRYIYSFLILFVIVLAGSCRNDFESVPSTGNLEFSKDTVYLDTVFTNIGSSTYTLKVYNRSGENINISSVRLANGETSHYRLNVDGVPGKIFNNVEILAKDSIFIFIETTIDINTFPGNSQFLYTDAIEFDAGSNQQKVELVTLVQDAVFLYPQRFDDGTSETLTIGNDEDSYEIWGFFLDDNELHFTNEKPYVIYGYAAVPFAKTLTIDAGARIHFHESSGLLVANQATIKANGSISSDSELLENEIIFQGDRLEPAFSDVPGQWGTIWLTAGSTAHEFNYTTIKNATIGIQMDSNDGGPLPTLTLKNTQIYNNSFYGLWAKTGHIYGENVIINNSGQSSLNISLGGIYEFKHCTFANYWNSSFRQFPAVAISNALQVSESQVVVADLQQADFYNCIIYGSDQREFSFDQQGEAAFNFNFQNNLLRFNDPQGDYVNNPLYDFTDTTIFSENVFNQNPDFLNPPNNQLLIGADSGADNIANQNIANDVPLDILGVDRTSNPDAGAYQSVVFPED
ncbi:MAG TPA: hypothetical protein VFD80_09760 [Flavobacteriaceae bacterium]|nr:hypothetical protein [Flavobacteriaceae bacterium]